MAIQKEKVSWSDNAARALNRALGDDLKEIKAEVETGASELWKYKDGYIVTRLEVTKSRKELVIVASGVKNGAEKLADWVQIAKANGCSVRLHSNRLGMKNFVKKQGFEVLETVYRWENGRKFQK